MAEDKLPEELVCEILRQCILASSETFLDPANNRALFYREGAPSSPLGSSQLLRVSKRWRRIGTPLLYTSLWLSKAFHTLAVADLFLSHPSLAEHVVDLRLDGGFIPQLLEIVRLASSVHNVYISWHLDALDDTSTLRKVLPCLQPQTLYLGHQRSDLTVRRKSDALSTQVDSLIADGWSSLRHVHLAYWYQLNSSTSRALRDASSLEEICIHSEDIENWSWSTNLLEFLHNPSLRTIRTRSTLSPDFSRSRMLEHGVRKTIVDRLTFVRHSIEWGEFDEPVADL